MIFKIGITIFIFIAYRETGHSHARMKSDTTIMPRSSSDSLKSGPCGGLAKSPNPKTLSPGATITINWEETINHPGRFEFYFSTANDSNFTLLKTVPDNSNATNDLPHQFNTTITLPNVSCDNCTLQMIQVMTDRNPPSNYYSCADIRLSQSSGAPEIPPVPPQVPKDDCKSEPAKK